MSSITEQYRQRMTENDNTFFEKLGQCIAKLRKDQNMTQGQLAEYLNIFQQHITSFIRKLSTLMLQMQAQLLCISADGLVGLKNSVTKRGLMPKLQQQFDQVTLLPKIKQKFVSGMLNSITHQQGGGQ